MKSKIHIWLISLVVSNIALCIAIGTTLTEKRHSTIKNRLSHKAVIEEPAYAMIIKGRILDPNNEPALGARIVALPVTSWGYEIRHNNKEGYFELPWSQTWIEDDQPIYLIGLIQDPKSEAALVEVADPTLPVTVRLKPALWFVTEVNKK